MTDFSKFQVKLPPVNLESVDIDAILSINVDNLEETLRYQPTLYCTFGLIARDAERQLAEVEAKIEILEGAVKSDMTVRATVDQKKKRVVKADITAECNASPEYLALKAEQRKLEHAAKICVTIEEAFRQRFGMVQQIAKRRSNELTQLGQTP